MKTRIDALLSELKIDYVDQIPSVDSEERRRARKAFRDFVEGAAAGDAARMLSDLRNLDFGDIHGFGWPRAMRAIARIGSVPQRTRDVFLRLYVRFGDHIRQRQTIGARPGLRRTLAAIQP
jgi:hypothetical protein